MSALFEMVYASKKIEKPIDGGMWVILNSSIGSFGNSNWSWVGKQGWTEIYLGSGISGDFEKFKKMTPEEQNLNRERALSEFLLSPQIGGTTTIHELMHCAFKGRVKHGLWSYEAGDDLNFADAAADLAGDPRPVYIPPEAVLFRASNLPSHIIIGKKNTAASTYWGQRLNQACGYPSHLDKITFTDFKLYKGENK